MWDIIPQRNPNRLWGNSRSELMESKRQTARAALTQIGAAALLPLLASLLLACGGGGGTEAAYNLQQLAVGDREMREIPQEHMMVSMIGVSDSRCPAGALCISAGHAAVDLIVRTEDLGPQALTLTLGAGARDGEATFGGFQFLLTGLSPYPGLSPDHGPIPIGEYRADVTVRRQ
jgi:hypothetical protein